MERTRSSKTAPVFNRQDALKIFPFILAYFLALFISFLFPDAENILMAVCPAGGVGLAALLLNPRRLWSIIIGALFVAGIAANLIISRPLFASLGFMTTDVLESLGCAWLLMRICGDQVNFSRVRGVLALLLAATLVNAVTAFLGAGTATLTQGAFFWKFWRTWWVADCLGILLITPLIVTWSQPSVPLHPTRGQAIEYGLFFTIWCTFCWLSFETNPPNLLLFTPSPYFLFALLVWPALRFGQRCVTLAIFILAVLALSSDSVTAGPLLWGGSTHEDRLILLQLYLGVIAVTEYLLAASYFEAKSAEREAIEEKQKLSRIADNLPNGVVYQVVREHDGKMRFLYASAAIERINGIAADEVLRDADALYRMVLPEDRPRVAAAKQKSAELMKPFEIIVRLRRADGELRWMQIIAAPRRLEDERILWDGIQLDVTGLRSSEEAVLQSRAILKQILDTVPQSIFWKDRDSVYLGCNAVFAKAVGVENSELIIGKTDFDLPWPTEEAEAYRSDDRQVITSRQAKRHIIEPLQQADGTRIWIDTTKVPLVDGQGYVYGVLGVYEDITTRKAAEEKLKKSEAQLRASQEVARLGSWEQDLVSQKLEWSDETYRLFDKNPQEFTPTFDAFAAMVHPVDQQVMQARFDKALASDDEPYHVVVQIVNASGRKWTMEAFGTVIRDESGKPVRIFGTAQDVTSAVKTSEALRQSERMLRNLLDSVDEGFIVIDRDYRILNANRAYCQMAGLDTAEVVGRHCYQITHHSEHPCHEHGEVCAPRLVFETGEPQISMHHHMEPGGQVIYVETKAFPLEMEAGRVSSVIEVVNNITERQLLEEQRLKTQKLEAVGTLAGGIAHDFNNLLQGVFGYISMAKLSVDDKGKCTDMLAQAEKALKLSVNLTRQLLTFSKGGKPVRKKIDPRPLIGNAVKFALSGSKVDFDIVFGEKLWMVMVDEGQVAQVIQNIVLNADQAMPNGGTLRVTAHNVSAPAPGLPPSLAPGKYLEVALQDSGTGIPAEHLPKIFDPYFTTKQRGSGLGLATSYSIIKHHGSIIDVHSEEGRGSTFTFWLQAEEAGEEQVVAVLSPAPDAKKYRILIMDDEEMIRNLAGEMLKRLGHEVETAVKGEEAIAKYRLGHS